MNELPQTDPGPWRRRLVTLFGIDPRSLAAFRIGMALVILYDVIDRIGDFDAMYRDSGVMSVADAKAHYSSATWSLYFLSSADWFQALLLGLTVLSCAMMAVGCFTRVATLLTWVLVASLHARMPLVLHSGDLWTRCLLFWTIFLPLGHVWSVDALLAGRRVARATLRPVLSVATAGVLVQVAIVYLFAGIAKWNDFWLKGEAMHYVFDQLIFIRPLAKTLLQYPWICRFLSYSTLAFELSVPLLVFLPWGTRLLRIAIVMVAITFHVGIELTLNVGNFSYIAFSCWMLFLPAIFWDLNWAPRRWRRAESDRTGQAVLQAPALGRVSTILCAGALAFVILYNSSWIAGDTVGRSVRKQVRPAALQLRLTQKWRMFGVPYQIDSWCVYRARLRSGEVVDLIRGGDEPKDTRPDRKPSMFPRHRWNKMHQRLELSTGGDPRQLKKYRQQVARYICRKWNREHGPDQQVVRLDVLLYGTQIGPKARKKEYSGARGFATVELADPVEASEFQSELLRIERGEDPF